MRSFFRITTIAALFALPLIHLASTGCGNSDNSCPSGDCDAFDTYQACWDEHHTVENFSVQRAIEICCIDHPIGSEPMNVVCGDTADTCTAYVTTNLDPADATADDISTACSDYVADRAG